MAQPLSPTFPAFTDPRLVWANVAAINAFFNAFTFTIAGNNLPEPTIATLGGVMSLTLSEYEDSASVTTTVDMNDGAGDIQSVPTNAAFLALVARVDLLANYIAQLDTQLRSQGYVAS